MSRWLAMGAGVVLLSAVPRTLDAPTQTEARIVILAPSEAGSWLLGARLGVEEAIQAAQLMHRKLHVVEITSNHEGSTAMAAAAARVGTLVVVAGEGGEALRILESVAIRRDLVLLDARPQYPREARCLPGVFRLGLPLGPRKAHTRPVLWHDAVATDGADQLRKRFRERFGQTMDGPAWVGWFAVKVAAAATLGVDAASPGRLEGFLRSRAASFDGHKGQPLRFDAANGTLIQPTYVLDREGAPEEVSHPGVTECA